MTQGAEHQPGTIAPVTGHYLLLNVFGSPVGESTHIRCGEGFPDAPRDYSCRVEQETGEDECSACRQPPDVLSGHPIAPRAAWFESHLCGVVRIDPSELVVDSSRLLMLRHLDPARIAGLGDGGRSSSLKVVP